MDEGIAGKRIQVNPLPPYEGQLLATLAFFLRRKPATQALNCLSMYLRQGEARIRGQAQFYARQVGMEVDDLMRLIYQDPQKAQELLGEWWKATAEEDEGAVDEGEDE
jgi:hypothetical protein